MRRFRLSMRGLACRLGTVLFILCLLAGLHRPVKIVGLVGCRVLIVLWSHCGEQPTTFPRKGTGVLWVLTGNHPCDTSTQGGWWRNQSASPYVRVLSYTWSCLLPVVLW